MNGITDLGTLVIRMTADNASFDASMVRSAASILGVGAAAASTAAAVVAMGIAGTKAYNSFEGAMTKSMAIMSENDRKLRGQMEETAMSLASNGVDSAEQLAKGYYYLASAGLDAERSMRALSVAQSFAVAGDMQLEKATESLTDSIANLGLATKDSAQYAINMRRVSDVLVRGGADSNASTEQLAVSLRTKLGSALRDLGRDVEEGVAWLMVLGNQGVKAENAGESLTIVLRDLQRAAILNKGAWDDFGMSVFDNAGKMRSLADIIEQMEVRLGAFSDEGRKQAMMQLGFQDRTVSATKALMGFSAQARESEVTLRKAGDTTRDVFNYQMTATENQVKSLSNSMDVMVTKMGKQFNPEIRAAADYLKEAASAGSDLDSIMVTLGDTFGWLVSTTIQLAAGFKFVFSMASTGIMAVALGIGSLVTTIAKYATVIPEAVARIAILVYSLGGIFVNTVRLIFNSLVIEAKDSANAVIFAVEQAVAKIRGKATPEYKPFFDVEATKKDLAAINTDGFLQKMRDAQSTTGGFFDGIRANIDDATKTQLDYISSLGDHASKLTDEYVNGMDKFDNAVSKNRDTMLNTGNAVASSMDTAKASVMSLSSVLDGLKTRFAAVRNAAMGDQVEGLYDPGVQEARGRLDPLRATRDQRKALEDVVEQSKARVKILQGMYAAGYIESEEALARAIQKTTLSQKEYNALITDLNLKGDLTDPMEEALNKFAKYDVQVERSRLHQEKLNAELHAGKLSVEEYEQALRNQTVTEEEALRKKGEILAGAFGTGKNVLLPGTNAAAQFGQPGYDYSQAARPTGDMNQDQMNALVAEEKMMTESYERRKSAVEDYYQFEIGKADEKNRILQQMEANHMSQMRANDAAQTQLVIGSSQSIAESMTSIAADTAGKQSGIYKTMFAISKAFAIADASVKIAQGIAAAAANPFPYNLAAMASVAAATASIVSNIMSVRMTSFEGGGMTPGGPRTGGVDGKGGMLSVLHPNERVIDLQAPKDRGGSFGGEVSVTVHNYAPGSEAVVKQSPDGKDIQIIIEQTTKRIASDIRTGKGPVPAAMVDAYGVTRGR